MDNEPTILIVDDDPNLTKTLSDIVRLQGYRPLAAAKGKTALDRLNGEMPAAALIDLKLPDMDGLEVMREIKKRSPDTECIVLTGYGSRDSAIEAMNLGAYGHMQKPYDVEQLVLTIRRAIEKREAEEEIRQKTADLTLINSLNNAINRGDSLRAVIQLLSRETKKIFSSSGATMYLVSEDKEHLVMQNLSLPPRMVGGIEKLIGMEIPEIRIPLKAGSPYRQALEAGQPQLINDPATIQSLMAEFTENKTLKKLVPKIYGILGIRSVMNVPLVSDGEAIGLLDISSREPFAESDLHRLETISGQLTVAIRRKKAEEATQLACAELDQIFSTSADGMRVVDKDFNVLRTNDTFSNLSGISIDEAVGKKCYKVFPGSMCDTPSCPLTRILGREQRVEYDVEKERSDGTRIPCIVTATPFRGPGGELAGIVEDFKDITERKRAEEQLQRSLQETARGRRLLLALSQAAQAVERARTPEEVYQTVGDEITRLGYHATIFTLTDDRSHLAVSHLTFASVPLRAAEKLAGLSAQNYRFPLVPGGFFQQIIAEGETTFTEPMAHHMAEALPKPVRPLASRLAALLGLEQSIIAPLRVGGETHGLLTVTGSGLTEGDVPAVTAFANQAGIAIENAQAYERLEEQNLQTIAALATAVEARDPYTSGHSEKVTELAMAIAEKMGLSSEEIDSLRMAGLLHNIGKIGVPDSVLNKPSRLTAAERIMVNSHPIIAAEIVGKIKALAHLVPAIKHHHEQYDGEGYPDGLKGEDIPLLARILAVTDEFEAMTSERPYRLALTEEEALAELEKGAGIQWDPQVVELFLKVLETERDERPDM